MAKYVFDRIKGKVVPITEATPYTGPYIVPDLPDYRSPMGTGIISGRRQRREDLKRANCRELDPSERIDSTPKSQAQAAEERAYLKAREAGPQANLDPRTLERLLRD